jgi:hypothetical protein
MAAHSAGFAALAPARDGEEALEGRVWTPAAGRSEQQREDDEHGEHEAGRCEGGPPAVGREGGQPAGEAQG